MKKSLLVTVITIVVLGIGFSIYYFMLTNNDAGQNSNGRIQVNVPDKFSTINIIAKKDNTWKEYYIENGVSFFYPPEFEVDVESPAKLDSIGTRPIATFELKNPPLYSIIGMYLFCPISKYDPLNVNEEIIDSFSLKDNNDEMKIDIYDSSNEKNPGSYIFLHNGEFSKNDSYKMYSNSSCRLGISGIENIKEFSTEIAKTFQINGPNSNINSSSTKDASLNTYNSIYNYSFDYPKLEWSVFAVDTRNGEVAENGYNTVISSNESPTYYIFIEYNSESRDEFIKENNYKLESSKSIPIVNSNAIVETWRTLIERINIIFLEHENINYKITLPNLNDTQLNKAIEIINTFEFHETLPSN